MKVIWYNVFAINGTDIATVELLNFCKYIMVVEFMMVDFAERGT